MIPQAEEREIESSYGWKNPTGMQSLLRQDNAGDSCYTQVICYLPYVDRKNTSPTIVNTFNLSKVMQDRMSNEVALRDCASVCL